MHLVILGNLQKLFSNEDVDSDSHDDDPTHGNCRGNGLTYGSPKNVV